MSNQQDARKKLANVLVAVIMGFTSLLTIAQAQPASAATSQFKGVNWADARDNYNSGWVIPTGLAAGDTYTQVNSIANNYIKAFQSNLGANTVRLPINPPSVNSSWWNSYRGRAASFSR